MRRRDIDDKTCGNARPMAAIKEAPRYCCCCRMSRIVKLSVKLNRQIRRRVAGGLAPPRDFQRGILSPCSRKLPRASGEAMNYCCEAIASM